MEIIRTGIFFSIIVQRRLGPLLELNHSGGAAFKGMVN